LYVTTNGSFELVQFPAVNSRFYTSNGIYKFRQGQKYTFLNTRHCCSDLAHTSHRNNVSWNERNSASACRATS